MKGPWLLALICCVFGAGGFLPANAAEETKWEKVFGCEFKHKEDLKKWNLNAPSAWTKGHEYVKDAFHVHDGSLFIEARELEAGSKKRYTSGAMNTRGECDIKYGKVECRLRVPKGRGFRTQCLLMPLASKSGNSISVLDVSGNSVKAGAYDDHGTATSLHGESEADLSDDFHTVAVEWREKKLAFFLDGKLTISSKDEPIPADKMFLVIALTVTDPFAPDTHFPNALEVDYVRVYEAK